MTIDELRSALFGAAPPRLKRWLQSSANWQVNAALRRAWGSIGYRADIPWGRAEAAFRNTSHSPERRAESAINGYSEHIEQAEGKLNPEQFAAYREGYRQRYLAWLGAASNVASPMITGPANFPVAQQEKRRAAEDNRRNELNEWSTAFFARIAKDRAKEELAAAGGPVAELERNIVDRKQQQDLYKRINVILRQKGDSKHAELEAMNLSEDIRFLIKNYGGIPSFRLTNNLAEIKRLEARLDVERKKSAQGAFSVDFEPQGAFPGGTVDYNVGADRLQITFTSRLPREQYEQMAGRAFKTTKDGIFQRQLTDAAISAARQILGLELPYLGAA